MTEANGERAIQREIARKAVDNHERDCPARQGIAELSKKFAVSNERLKRISEATDRIEAGQRANAVKLIITLAGWLFAGGLLVVNLIVR